jgi:hypothetical protein
MDRDGELAFNAFVGRIRGELRGLGFTPILAESIQESSATLTMGVSECGVGGRATVAINLMASHMQGVGITVDFYNEVSATYEDSVRTHASALRLARQIGNDLRKKA